MVGIGSSSAKAHYSAYHIISLEVEVQGFVTQLHMSESSLYQIINVCMQVSEAYILCSSLDKYFTPPLNHYRTAVNIAIGSV